jgi:hypothetical protein
MGVAMGVCSWLCGVGAAGLAALVRTVFRSSTLTGAVADGVRRAAETKGHVDRGMNTILNLLGLPSKVDHNRLLSKVEVLQGSLVNLNIKMDRLLAAGLRSQRDAGEAPGGPTGMPGPDPAEP